MTVREILISAAEPSGDQLAAELIRTLSRHEPIRAMGLAGPCMRAAGVEPLATMEDICAMGVTDVLARLPAILSARNAVRYALSSRPAAAVFIDAPDLHLPLGRHARSLGVPAIGWVSPQVWAWRPERADDVTRSYDKLLCLFDFEPDLFPNLDARFTGHPVLDRLESRTTTDRFLYGLAPGSRPQETRRLWPLFTQAARNIRERIPEARFVVVSPVNDLSVPDWIDRGDTAADFSPCRAVLTKSGTITLELAVLGVPQVVAHRVHPVTAWLGRRLVRGIDHIAMPNVLAGQEVIPEFIQDLKPPQLATAVLDLPESQPVNLSALGEPGAIDRTARLIRTWMGDA